MRGRIERTADSDNPPRQSAFRKYRADCKPTKGTIAHVDATQRRTEKMRRMASEGGQKGRASRASRRAAGRATNGDTAYRATCRAERKRTGTRSGSAVRSPRRPAAKCRNGRAAARRPPPAPVAAPAPAPAPVAAAAPSAPAKPTTTTSAPAPAELEKFLINFVVEQTGYPPEVVELDADLEADLGIDSIKKAQLFGELAEYFDVQPAENLTLDDFPTLRHVLNFLATATVKGDLSANGSIAAPAGPRSRCGACCRSGSSSGARCHGRGSCSAIRRPPATRIRRSWKNS